MSEEPRGVAKVLLEQASPNGNVLATVEEQRGVVYVYLHGAEEVPFAPRACWVRNLRPAPAELEEEAIKAGEPPLLPANACAHPQGAPPLDPQRLRLVWFEEGDGVALLEGDEILAAVPGWSGADGFHGYARDATQATPLAAPLKGVQAIVERVLEAEAFWRSWEQKPWPELRDRLLAACDRAFPNPHANYYAIDGGKWPPRALIRYESPRAVALVTLGVSIRPQPTVERYVEDPRPHRRIELGFAFARQGVSEEQILAAARYVSGQANLPWETYSWLGDGHTIECDPFPLGGDEFGAMLLLKHPSGAQSILLPAYRNDPINLLWMIPITAAERALAVEEGTGALLARLAPNFPLWPHRARASVA